MRMRLCILFGLMVLPLTPLYGQAPALSKDRNWQIQEISRELSIGYAVHTADLNKDGKPDILVVDKHRIIWFENPNWKMHTIVAGKTKPDNVCAAIWDVDGDGRLDVIVGADWAPFQTQSGGTLQWFRQPETIDDEWKMYPIAEEPTVHRIYMVADFFGTKQPALILAPLMGRDASKQANWLDGRPVRLLAFRIPKNPLTDAWKAEVIHEELHMVHNIHVVPTDKGGHEIFTASYEGVSRLTQPDGKNWQRALLHPGNQETPKSNRGASEIRYSRKFDRIATVEPWHGHEIVLYQKPNPKEDRWQRMVLDSELRWGHALAFADLDGTGNECLIAGVRDNPAKGDKFSKGCGVRIYQLGDKEKTVFSTTVIDDGGMACEDLTVADLDGDGRLEIIAVGRATKNVRIYWLRK